MPAKILVVDDIPTNIRAVKEILGHFDAKVYISTSGAKAIEMIQKEHYDLVFMDQMMPDMDGMETIARIRALGSGDSGLAGGPSGGYFRELPIVMLTANTAMETDEALVQKGINGYLTKPVNTEQLSAALKKWLPAGIIEPLSPPQPNEGGISVQLDVLKTALIGMDIATVNRQLRDCTCLPLDSNAREKIFRIEEQVLLYEYDTAIALIDAF
jgi:CheY-like chemotaxis protein